MEINTGQEKCLNDAVDQMAKDEAVLHNRPITGWHHGRRRRGATEAIQRMMAAILMARRPEGREHLNKMKEEKTPMVGEDQLQGMSDLPEGTLPPRWETRIEAGQDEREQAMNEEKERHVAVGLVAAKDQLDPEENEEEDRHGAAGLVDAKDQPDSEEDGGKEKQGAGKDREVGKKRYEGRVATRDQQDSENNEEDDEEREEPGQEGVPSQEYDHLEQRRKGGRPEGQRRTRRASRVRRKIRKKGKGASRKRTSQKRTTLTGWQGGSRKRGKLRSEKGAS